MQTQIKSTVDKLILDALVEDCGELGDITAEAIFDVNHTSSFQLIVNENAVLAGLDVFKKTFKLIDETLNIKLDFSDADSVSKNSFVCSVSGKTRAILKGERTALNFLSHLSGIATKTNELVELIKHTNTVLLDTRKTTPNLRFLEKQAVLAGGGKNHRFNLGEMILIKDNHVNASGSLITAVLQVRKKYGSKFKIEVEVQNINQLKEAIDCNVDIIMFDNWSVEDLKTSIKLVPKEILTEASGQISKDNIKMYAETGVNYISTGYMVKNGSWIDFSLDSVC